MVLAFLVLPLTSLLVPLLMLRRVPRKQRKVAWQLFFPLVAGIAMGIFGNASGGEAVLADRGVWADVVVVRMEDTGTNSCDLRMVNGREISLSEGDGCDDWVSKGDKLRVLYDPEGVASPTEDPDSSSYGGLLGSLFVVTVVMSTWGGVRQSRWDREYGGA
ncbi:hypothetical protein [Streptomyces sp. SAI-229]|uniref:hypothetical protein n=1 Tax=Streptomyces sp. SAI-229 TaxID=3377731 RepID=UPI003C7B2A7E